VISYGNIDIQKLLQEDLYQIFYAEMFHQNNSALMKQEKNEFFLNKSIRIPENLCGFIVFVNVFKSKHDKTSRYLKKHSH
jgi:hypothetical protein